MLKQSNREEKGFSSCLEICSLVFLESSSMAICASNHQFHSSFTWLGLYITQYISEVNEALRRYRNTGNRELPEQPSCRPVPHKSHEHLPQIGQVQPHPGAGDHVCFKDTGRSGPKACRVWFRVPDSFRRQAQLGKSRPLLRDWLMSSTDGWAPMRLVRLVLF